MLHSNVILMPDELFSESGGSPVPLGCVNVSRWKTFIYATHTKALSISPRVNV